MASRTAGPNLTCADCRTPLGPGDPTRASNGDTLCVPCFEIREQAFGTLASHRAAGGGLRRGPRHLVPRDVAARITLFRSDGTTGHAEPVLEVSRHGFRVGAAGQHEAGQRLQCVATLPGRVGLPAHFDVEVRWCRRDRADRFEIGVEVAAEDADRYGELYRTLLTAIGAEG